jgi:tetratricopeptide (TPR) repeat protein
MESARALGRHDDFALAAIRFCDVNEWSPDDEEARASVEEALQLVDERDRLLRARLCARRAYLRLRAPDAIEIARDAARQARAVGDPQTLQEALYVLLYALAGPDHLDERRGLGDELFAAALQLKNPDSAVIALLDIGSDYLAIGDPKNARRMRDAVARLIGERPALGPAWHTGVFDVGWALLDGRLDHVEQAMTDALLFGTRIAHPYARVCFEAQWMQLHRYRGEYDAIDDLFRPGTRIAAGSSHWPRTIYARNQFMSGHTDRALELWEDLARFEFSDLARGIRWISTMVEIAHLCADLEDTRRAEMLIPMLSAVDSLHGVLPMTIIYGGPASYGLARLHEIMGDADAAIECYEAALEAAIGLGARPVQASIQRDMARPIARRGDRPRAAALEDEAETLARRIGCRL